MEKRQRIRLVADVNPELQHQFKVLCAIEGKTVSDKLKELVIRELKTNPKCNAC